MTHRRQNVTFAKRLAKKQILLAPGIYDALSALIAEQTGFEAVYLSGASIAYTRLDTNRPRSSNQFL